MPAQGDDILFPAMEEGRSVLDEMGELSVKAFTGPDRGRRSLVSKPALPSARRRVDLHGGSRLAGPREGVVCLFNAASCTMLLLPAKRPNRMVN